MTSFIPFYFAILTNVCVFILARLLGLFKREPFHLAFGRLHATFAIVYFAGVWIYTKDVISVSFSDYVIGLLVYFMWHFLISLYVIGVVTRSVSMNLLILLEQQKMNSPILIEDLLKQYANGKGWDYLRRHRVSVMFREGLVEEKDGRVQITTKGRFLLSVQNILLNFWRLRDKSSDQVTQGQSL